MLIIVQIFFLILSHEIISYLTVTRPEILNLREQLSFQYI